MAARLVALREGDETSAADGAVEKIDDYTVRLNLFTPDISLIPSFGDYPALCGTRPLAVNCRTPLSVLVPSTWFPSV